jgi:outer membrane protein with beta-barrel domain
MKKILLIAVVMIASLNVMNAQVTFGAKLGLNLANISGSPTASASSSGYSESYSNGMNIGFQLGGICNYAINENFSINGELLYHTGGTKQTYTSSSTLYDTMSTNETDKISLSYIQIPITARYKLDNGLSFEAGLYFGILAGASENVSGTTSSTFMGATSTTSISQDTSISSYCNSVDIGLVVGVGYQMPSGLGFSARYNVGLTDIFKAQTYGSVTEAAYGTNGIISLAVFYMFGASK